MRTGMRISISVHLYEDLWQWKAQKWWVITLVRNE